MMAGIQGNDDEQQTGFSAKYVTCCYEKAVLITACFGIVDQQLFNQSLQGYQQIV